VKAARECHIIMSTMQKRNASTRLPTDVPIPLKDTSPEVAYRLAVTADKERERGVGYRLWWLSANDFASYDVPVDDESFLVLGRHDKCDVVLEGDPTIALRHLLVRAQLLDDGCPRLSVLDLSTDIGFQVAGGPSERSISATGPIVFRVGAFAIVALPQSEPAPPALPEPTCSRSDVAHPYREPGVPAAITFLPRALELGESDVDASGPGFTLGLRGERGTALVHLSSQDLETGVLVGRAPKCRDDVKDVLHEGISRVHLLLRRGWAYDLASTQGTYVRDMRVRCVRLDDAGTDIRIGKEDPIYLSWCRR
jgi:hypothetical protein